MSRLGSIRLALPVAGALAMFVANPANAEYKLGQGVSLFDDRFVVGGYANIVGAVLDEQRDVLVVDDLSTFLTLHLGDRWLLFTEAELEDPVHVDRGGFGSGDDVFRLERLYVQWESGDRFQVRAGQMLTPIGIWNVIHAAPLVWTTSRPIATDQFFDTGLTGVEATWRTRAGAADIALKAFGQATGQIDDTGQAQDSRRAVGGRIEAGGDRGPRIGASLVHFDDRRDRRNETAFGADFFWSLKHVELSSELAVNAPDSGRTTWAAYLQGVAHTPWHLHPVLRVEYADLGPRERVPVVIGLAWKPAGAMIVKLEAIVGGEDTSLGGEGFLASFAVLF